jgi:hypothetical protein
VSAIVKSIKDANNVTQHLTKNKCAAQETHVEQDQPTHVSSTFVLPHSNPVAQPSHNTANTPQHKVQTPNILDIISKLDVHRKKMRP